MDLVVYAVYLVGLMAVYGAVVVSAFVRVPVATLALGGESGRFAQWANEPVVAFDRMEHAGRLTTVAMPKARAA